MNRILLIFITGLLLFSCESKMEKTASPEDLFAGKHIPSSIKYANLFDLYEYDGVRKIVIHSPFSDSLTSELFYLVDSSKYSRYKSFRNVLPFPLTNIAVLSATQLNAINKLGLQDKVTGIADAKYISDSTINRHLVSGKTEEVSVNGQLFVEKTIMLNPQAIFFSPYQQNQSLPLKGTIKVVPFFDFMESDPLGRAEWIKFTAAFIGKEKRANTIFAIIEKEYLQLEKVASSVHKKPSVFSGKYFNGQWFVPGGQSYMAQMFDAAGANYIWKNDSSRNSIALDFEVVVQKAQHADYWRILGGLSDKNPYENLLAENPLYKHFKAFEKHQIIYCNPSKTSYFEKATLEPHIVLKDFIFAFHPELFPGYQPVYYNVLP